MRKFKREGERVAFIDAVHQYGCPATRLWARDPSRDCLCGAEELEQKLVRQCNGVLQSGIPIGEELVKVMETFISHHARIKS